MAAAFKASLGSNFNNASGTTLAITTTAAIAIGDLVVVRWAADNLSATTPTATCADGGNTYTGQRQAAANATAAAGIAGGLLTSLATVARPSGSTITLTFSGAIVGKAAYAESFTSVLGTTRVAAVGSSGTTGTAATSGASAAGILTGDLVLGFSAVQTRIAATGDTDTTNGAWSAKVGVNGGGTSGNDNTSVQINGQYKIVTAGGAQTYDNTVTSTYWLTGLVVLQGVTDLATLTDTFDAAVDKVTKWPGSSAAVVWDSATASCKIPITTSYWALQTNLASGQTYNFVGSSIYAKCTPGALGTGTREMQMQVVPQGAGPYNDMVFFNISGANLLAIRKVTGTNTTLLSATYSAINHAWLRIRESGGTVFFDTSPDGTTWTNFTSTTVAWDKTKVGVAINAGYYGTETAADAFVDNVGITPGYPKVYTGSAFVKKPLKVWDGSTWLAKPVKVWTGTVWKTLT